MTGRFFALEASSSPAGGRSCAIHGDNKGRCKCREKKVRWSLVASGESYPVVRGVPGDRMAGGFIPATILRPGL
jgi:hypothetical protein